MNPKSIQQTGTIGNTMISVVNNVLLGILGIQTALILIPVHTGDKRFNQ